MITNPKSGWCKFTITDFIGTPSYTTDVPTDLLTAFIDYYEKGAGAAYFDEEGTEFTLILSNFSVFIIYIDAEGSTTFHCFPQIKVDDLARELVEDITSNVDAWSQFDASVHSEKEYLQKRSVLVCLLNKLTKLLDGRY